MKLVSKPGRFAVATLGVALAAAGLLAASAPAIAAGRPHSSNHGAANQGAAAPATWARLPGLPGLPGLTWPQNVPRPGSSSELEGIYCPKARDCWAVGQYDQRAVDFNQILHWNGKRWSQVAAPSPGGTKTGDSSELFAVRCSSASSCWAVGEYEKNDAELGEALHWNGKHWAEVTIPNPAGTGNGDFNLPIDVFCTSAKSCWTVGDYGFIGSGKETFLNLALHWNGKHWAKVNIPDPAGIGADKGNGLDGIRCPSARDCWAVGTDGTLIPGPTLRDEALHWNGKHWSNVKVVSPGGGVPGAFSELNGVACLSARDCWTIGTFGNISGPSEKTLSLALHWNGKHWARITIPDPEGTSGGADNDLLAVTCFSSANCWAVGDAGMFGDHGTLNEAVQWNGHRWFLRKPPNPAGTANGDSNILNAARCLSPKDCWAVGAQQTSGGGQELNELLRWNGTKWVTG